MSMQLPSYCLLLHTVFLLSNLTCLARCGGTTTVTSQSNTFASHFALSPQQYTSFNLTPAQAETINVAIRFERSNWASSQSVTESLFYTDLPRNASTAPPGSVLKVEPFTNTTTYTIPPTLAVSRIIYQSKNLNDTLTPVSAFILWPYQPRQHQKSSGGASTASIKAPLVSWGHGTSGIHPDCAPSHIRNLGYAFSAPFELALQGYAVVATDYAGLGVSRRPDGTRITHQYDASQSSGHDMLYAAQAAHAAFPDHLTQEFVVMGHSQGGGAAWAAAEQQQLENARVPGYLGAIAASPVTSALALAKLEKSSIGLLTVAQAIRSAFPDVPFSDMLTDRGVNLVRLLDEIGSCNSADMVAIVAVGEAEPDQPLTRNTFLDSPSAARWNALTSVGGTNFAGPMLVLQGTDDPTVPESVTAGVANRTCERATSHAGLDYVRANGVGHIPVMYATRQVWMQWLEERFSEGTEKTETHGVCTTRTIGLQTPRRGGVTRYTCGRRLDRHG